MISPDRQERAVHDLLRETAAITVGTAGAVVLLLGLVRPDLAELTSEPVTMVAAVVALVASAVVWWVGRSPRFSSGQRRVATSTFPLVVAGCSVSLVFVAGQASIMSLGLITTVHLAGLLSRRWVGIAILVVLAVSEVATLLRTEGASVAYAFEAVLVAGCILAMDWVVRDSNAAAVARQREARLAADARRDAVTSIVASAPRIHVLDEGRAMAAITDAAEQLGWRQAALRRSRARVDDADGGDPTVADPADDHSDVAAEALANGHTALRVTREPSAPESPHVVIAVPVPGTNGIIGTIEAAREDAPGTHQVEMLELLAVQAGLVLETITAFRQQQRAMAEVERVASVREDFVATVSHELRTPIHVASGLAETLLARGDDLSPEDHHHLLERLAANGAELRDLVDGLLDFSRLRAGRLEPRVESCELADLVTGPVAQTRARFPDHVVSASLPPDTEVEGDPLLIGRAIDNLLRNACQHTPAGTSVHVTIVSSPSHVDLAVRDDGPGVPPDEVHRLAQRFYRGGDHLRRSGRGMGLGLALVTEVLRLHGSRLEVYSQPGVRTTFAFSLPRRYSPPAPVGGPPTPRTESAR